MALKLDRIFPPLHRHNWQKVILVVTFACLFLLVGCGGNIAKMHIQQVGEYLVQFDHQGGEIEFWTDLDFEYRGDAKLEYLVDFYQEGQLVNQVVCDPFDLEDSRMTRNVELNGLIKQSYLAKMICAVDIPQGATRAIVIFDAHGEDLVIFRADLILK